MQNSNGCTELAAAVIRKAIDDLKLINHKKPSQMAIGWDAYNFLDGEGLDIWCDMIGLSADHVRKEIAKTNDLFKKYAITPRTVE